MTIYDSLALKSCQILRIYHVFWTPSLCGNRDKDSSYSLEPHLTTLLFTLIHGNSADKGASLAIKASGGYALPKPIPKVTRLR